jgi:hypothetical protein
VNFYTISRRIFFVGVIIFGLTALAMIWELTFIMIKVIPLVPPHPILFVGLAVSLTCATVGAIGFVMDPDK